MAKTQCIKSSSIMAKTEIVISKERKRFHQQDDVAGSEPDRIMVDGEGESTVPIAQI